MNDFTLEKTGNWPKEKYKITFDYFNEIKRNVLPAKIPSKNLFRFFKNPSANIDKILFDYSIPLINYENCSFIDDDLGSFYILQSNTGASSTYTWSPSTLRNLNIGQIFNYFSLDELYKTYSLNTVDETQIDIISFLLCPSRLVLVPTGVTFDSNQNKYVLTTETRLLTSSITYFDDIYAESLASLKLKEIQENTPTNFENLPLVGSLEYSLSSYRHLKEYPFIKFIETGNPYYYINNLNEFLSNQNIFIRANSTYVTYQTFFNINNNGISTQNYVGQDIPDFIFDKNNFFDSTFNINYNPSINKNFQTFQLMQSAMTSGSLESLDNTIQTLNWNLTGGKLEYFTKTLPNDFGSPYPILSGVKNTNLSLTYVAESNKFFNNIDLVDNIGSSIQNTPLSNPRTWTLNHPPHYYTFKVKYNNSSDFSGDTTTLNFNLSSDIFEKYPSLYQTETTGITSYSAFKIKTKLVSDFNFLDLNLSTYAKNDEISFSIFNIDKIFIPYLSCLYGSNFEYTYNLNTSPYIPAVSAENILIMYPKEIWGRLDVLLKSNLKNDNMGVYIDSCVISDLLFSEGKNAQPFGYPITIEKLFEKENSITISCATLSTTEVLPSRDLRGSDIVWSFDPPDANVKIVGVNYSNINIPTLTAITNGQTTEFSPNVFNNGQVVPFNDLTNTVTISGYGKNQLTIYLKSFKYDEEVSILTDSLLFDFFKDNTFILTSSEIQNENKTAIVSISSKVLYENSLFDIPDTIPLYWNWSLNDDTDTQRVTAYKLNGDIYTKEQILLSPEINNITFKVDLEDNNNVFDNNKLNVVLRSNYKDKLITGTIDIFISDFPDPSIFNVDFSTSYSNFPNTKISDTRNNQTVITRPKNEINTYLFHPNTDVLPTINAESIIWYISSNTPSTTTANYVEGQPIYYAIESTASITNVTLSATKATIQGWPIKNNISSKTTIYTIPEDEFKKELEFIIYPPYTWLENNNGNILILNENNYTLAYTPTAYFGKLSNSQEFYVSASKEFLDYEYYYGSFNFLIDVLESRKDLVNIPYHTEFNSNIGTKISLTAYNEIYPKENGISYIGLKNINDGLYNGYFTITANTIPFSSVYFNTISSFKQNPKLIPYDQMDLSFVPKSTSIDMDQNIFVTVSQTITPINSSTSPVRTTQEFFDGIIVYTLSCKYWETQIDVSSVDGTYDLFILRLGDPSRPLYIKDSEITTLTLKASGVSPVYIPDSTYILQKNWTQKGSDIDGELFNDRSGTSVSLNSEGDVIAIGATLNDGTPALSNRGHVRVYKFNGFNWIKQGNDIDGENTNDQSGRTVSLNSRGDIIAIGAALNDGTPVLSNRGHVKVYGLLAGSWVQLGNDIDGENTNDQFGWAVSLNSEGDILAVGGIFNDDNGIDSGHVKIFKYANQEWNQLGNTIFPSNIPNYHAGHSISINSIGDTVAVGSINANNTSGQVKIYKFITNTWIQYGLDISGNLNDRLGTSIELNQTGDIIAIGVPRHDNTNGVDSGCVKVFEFTGINNPWVQLGEDIIGQSGFYLNGTAVSLNKKGDIVATGSPSAIVNGQTNIGNVRIFKFNRDLNKWDQIGTDINGENQSDTFGSSLKLNDNGDVIVIGAPLNDGNGSNSGHVRVYEINKDKDFELWGKIDQPLNVLNEYTLFAFSTSVKPKIFISSYYTTTAEPIFIQFETPENSFNYKITSYNVSFGDGLTAFILDDEQYFKTYEKLGVFNLSYSVNYSGGDVKEFKLETPIFVYPEWTRYDQSKIRLLNEIVLEFNGEDETYTIDQIEIQPNEWGDSDIFNTAISRLYSNYQYLLYNSQTINTDTPTLFYGWLGTNVNDISDGIKWHTVSYNKDQVNLFDNITDLQFESQEVRNRFSYFTDIKDSKEVNNRIYVIDNNSFRAFSSLKIPVEIEFENIFEINNLFINPVSIDSDESGENVFISDVFRNKIYKLNVDISIYPAQINLQLSIGNLGEREDNNKFNSPSEIVYKNKNLFVLDFNNKCVKQYTEDLNWVFTYYIEEFEKEQPINIAIHPETLLVYVLTNNYKIYIFDYFKNEIFETIDLSLIKNNNPVSSIFFDNLGDFIYVLDSKNIYKYSSSGIFINKVNISNEDVLTYLNGKSSTQQSIIINTKSAILKFQDILNIFKIGEGLSYNAWSLDQLIVDKDEFSDDITYNRCLNRFAQNIKAFRDILDSRFVIVTEQTDFGTIQYFSLYPVSYQNRPTFSEEIENEDLGVGVNEFHIPQVLNRELRNIHNALLKILDFLNLKDVRLLNSPINDTDTGCDSVFCWSWKSMSCYNLSLPIIRVCNINPITYEELENKFPSDYIYAPSNTYGQAIANCCDDAELPI